MRIRLAPQAREDLDSIWLYVAQESGNSAAATRMIESIAGRFLLLSRFPFIGRSLDSAHRPAIRALSAGNYIVFYDPRMDEIRILRVIHASRDAFAVFDQESS